MNTRPAVPLDEKPKWDWLLLPRLMIDLAKKAVKTVPTPMQNSANAPSTINSVNLKASTIEKSKYM